MRFRAQRALVEDQSLVKAPNHLPTNNMQVQVNVNLQAELDKELDRMIKTVNPLDADMPQPQ